MSDHETCDQCGFDGAEYDDALLLAELRALGPRWRALLTCAGSAVRQRPAQNVWSPIEYAAHSRDITSLHVFGVQQALLGHEPDFGEVAGDDLINDAAASYEDEDPACVADAIEQESTRLAQVAADAERTAWTRGLTVGGSRSDVRALLEHALHDSAHHLDDVERGLGSPSRPGTD
jgi:hypothetical protein